MADALTLILKEFLDAFKRYCLLPEKEYRKLIGNSSTALRNHLRGMMQVYENEEVHYLLKGATDLVNMIHLERFISLRKRRREKSTFDILGYLKYSREEVIDELIDTCEKVCKIKNRSNIEGEEVVVGFDEEVVTLLDQLTATSIKQFQVISIAGMVGLGKTTLARKLFNDPLVEYFFDIRAWTCVSQVYLVKDLLLTVLSSFIHELTDEIYKMSDMQLGEKLYRLLKGRNYLAVLDDILGF